MIKYTTFIVGMGILAVLLIGEWILNTLINI